MIRCKDCKHWDKSGETGYCKRIVQLAMVRDDSTLTYKHPEADDAAVLAAGALVEPEVPSYGASLKTSPSFGCVLGDTGISITVNEKENR